MSFWESLWNIVLVMFLAFVFIGAFYALVAVVTDLFRDRELSGWWKAVWLLFLIAVPLVTSIVYVIVRGASMAERSDRQARRAQEATEDYIREVAGATPAASPSAEIATARDLLKEGLITEAEYDALKRQALTGISN